MKVSIHCLIRYIMATSFGFRFLAVFFPREYVNFKPFEIADLQSTKKPDVSFAFELF